MIPPVLMYVLAAVLGMWGLYRLSLGWKKDRKWRGGHLFFGGLYVVMAVYLILATAGVIPPPRLFGRPEKAEPHVVEVVPLARIPMAPASGPSAAPAGKDRAAAPATAPSAAPAGKDRAAPR